MVIGIDGPAGSGKGTITKLLADQLGFINIDTGAMYRCVALASLNDGLSIDDKEKIIDLAKTIQIKFDKDQKVYLDGVDVSKEIREKDVTDIVSQISSIPEVREEMVKQQRRLAEGENVIMEGRDITTVVFPNADFKFYLDASVEERVRRRVLQNKEAGLDFDYLEIKKNIEMRDYNDMHKEVGALKRTKEQIYIDSTDMTIDEVVHFIMERIGDVK